MNGYKVNSNGRKEKDGFLCSSNTKTPSSIWWCVAVKIDEEKVQVRDSKDPSDTTLTFSHEEWEAFIEGVKVGEFDLPVSTADKSCV